MDMFAKTRHTQIKVIYLDMMAWVVLVKLFEAEIKLMLKLQIGQILTYVKILPIWSLSMLISHMYAKYYRLCLDNGKILEFEINTRLNLFYKHHPWSLSKAIAL